MNQSQESVDARPEALRTALEARRAEGRQPALLAAYRRLGEAYVSAGRPHEGESALRTSIQQARVHGNPAELGAGLLALGRALLVLGQRDRALLAYTEASQCWADVDESSRRQAEQALRALGSVPGGAR